MGDGKHRTNILFVCTYNKMRSRTGEELYKEDERFEVNSAGTDYHAIVRVNRELMDWADFAVVMEEKHKEWITEICPGEEIEEKIIVLDIPDEFYFMDHRLILLMTKKFEKAIREKMGRE